MQHTQLTNRDYRKVVKDWTMKQPDERQFHFQDCNYCLVGLFMKENPMFSVDYGAPYNNNNNAWTATHNDSIVLDGHYMSAVDPIVNAQGSFKLAKQYMQSHPMWADL